MAAQYFVPGNRGLQPAELHYVKGYLLKSKPSSDVTIRVFNENQNIPAIIKKILELKPHLTGFSCYLWNIKKMLTICRRLKKINPGLKIVLGGPEVSPRAEEILAKEKAIDVVARGEGEESFAQLVAQTGRTRISFKRGAAQTGRTRISFKRGAAQTGRSIAADLSGIRGISFRKSAEIIHNADRPGAFNQKRVFKTHTD